MSDPVVETRLAASPAAVLASLVSHVAAQGGRLEGIGGFGSTVTWRAFDRSVELVTLRAEITADDEPGLVRLTVRRVDAALEAALDCTPTGSAVRTRSLPAQRTRDAG